LKQLFPVISALTEGPQRLGYNGTVQYRLHRARLPENPLLQFIVLVLAAVVAVGAIFLGAILLSLFFGFALIAGIVLYIRLWWLRRSLGKRAGERSMQSGEFVEVEYTVVNERPPSDRASKGAED